MKLIPRYLNDSKAEKTLMEGCIDIDCNTVSSDSDVEIDIYSYAFEHHSISRAASDEWVAAMSRTQKQAMSNEYYTSKFDILKGVNLVHWGIHRNYPSISQIIKSTCELLKSSIKICIRQTQTPAYQTGHILKSMLWSGVYIWATTKMCRSNNNDPWNFKDIPDIYYFLESTFLWMLSYDYVIGLIAIWYRKESTLRYIFSFYQVIDFLSLPPFLLFIITISPLYESSQSWLLMTEKILDMLFPHVSAIKRRVIGAIFTIESPSEKNYNTLFDYFYYSIVTIGTVGYGDFSPQKREGRLVTIIVITLTLVLLPHEFQRLKEALNATPDSIGSFIRKNDTFLCIIGPIPPKLLLFIVKSLSQHRQRKFKSVVLVTPVQITEYQNIVKISQQRGYIRVSVKNGSFGHLVNSLVQFSSFVLIYGSEKNKLARKTEFENVTYNSDFDALFSAMCLINLNILKEKIFLILYSFQVANMSIIPGLTGCISMENLKIKLLSKGISNCPGFIPIMLHFFMPKNENILRRLQDSYNDGLLVGNMGKSGITPYEWKCRWRGLHFKVYTLKFPISFNGYPIKIFTKYIYKHLGIFLIGIFCPDTNKTYLNPQQFIIGGTSGIYYESSDYMGIVLSPNLSLIKKAELLELPKNYTEECMKKIGRKSCSPNNDFINMNSGNETRNSFDGKKKDNFEENVVISELSRDNYQNFISLKPDCQLSNRSSDALSHNNKYVNLNTFQGEKKLFNNHSSEFESSIHQSVSYDDIVLSPNNSKMLSLNNEETIINFGNEDNKYYEIRKINSSSQYYQNANFVTEINFNIPIVSNYFEAISKVFSNKEYPTVVIIGWYERIDVLIKSTFSLKPSNFIILCEQNVELRYLHDEYIGKIAQIHGIGTSEYDQKQAGILFASRVIIFDSPGYFSEKETNKLININCGMYAINSWITFCYIFSKYKRKEINPYSLGAQKIPPIIIDIKESDIGMLMFQYTDYWSIRGDGSIHSGQYKNELDFFYSRQFLSGQFFVDDIISSIVPSLIHILENNPVNKAFFDYLIDGNPNWKPFNNTKNSTNEKCNNLQMEEIPFIFVNSTFYNLFSKLLKHGRIAIGIYRPIRNNDSQNIQGNSIKNKKASYEIKDNRISDSSMIDIFNCDTHIIISCPPPKFKLNLGDCVYVL
ncbi:ion channel protein [Cryptosporidium felis]|nr:ion channel protein [Cryptosporidium felis]